MVCARGTAVCATRSTGALRRLTTCDWDRRDRRGGNRRGGNDDGRPGRRRRGSGRHQAPTGQSSRDRTRRRRGDDRFGWSHVGAGRAGRAPGSPRLTSHRGIAVRTTAQPGAAIRGGPVRGARGDPVRGALRAAAPSVVAQRVVPPRLPGCIGLPFRPVVPPFVTDCAVSPLARGSDCFGASGVLRFALPAVHRFSFGGILRSTTWRALQRGGPGRLPVSSGALPFIATGAVPCGPRRPFAINGRRFFLAPLINLWAARGAQPKTACRQSKATVDLTLTGRAAFPRHTDFVALRHVRFRSKAAELGCDRDTGQRQAGKDDRQHEPLCQRGGPRRSHRVPTMSSSISLPMWAVLAHRQAPPRGSGRSQRRHPPPRTRRSSRRWAWRTRSQALPRPRVAA